MEVQADSRQGGRDVLDSGPDALDPLAPHPAPQHRGRDRMPDEIQRREPIRQQQQAGEDDRDCSQQRFCRIARRDSAIHGHPGIRGRKQRWDDGAEYQRAARKRFLDPGSAAHHTASRRNSGTPAVAVCCAVPGKRGPIQRWRFTSTRPAASHLPHTGASASAAGRESGTGEASPALRRWAACKILVAVQQSRIGGVGQT